MPGVDILGGSSQVIHDSNGYTPSEQELVAFVNEQYDKRMKARAKFELQWRLNIAFIEGHQYMDINLAAMKLNEQFPMYEWQEREVFNHIAPNVETRIAKLARLRPALQTRSGTNSQEDIRSSKVGTMVLKNCYTDQNMTEKLAELAAWMEATGSAFLKHIWNPNKGKVIMKLRSKGEDGKEHDEKLHEGNLEVIVVPAQEILPDSCYRSGIADCRSIIHAKAYDVSEIKESWGIEVGPEKTSALKLQRSMVGAGGLGYGIGGYQYATSELENHAVVKEYSERPSKNYPAGQLIIVAGSKLLKYGPLPFPVDADEEPGLNFTKFDCIKRSGVFWGKSVVERLIPVQRRYNALRNRKADYMNRIAIGQYWVEEESLVDGIDVFVSQAGMPGAVHQIRRQKRPPGIMENSDWPAALETEERTLLQEFAIFSGVSELSRQSQAPAGVKSGVALSIALEQDDTRLSSTAGNIEIGVVNSGTQWLRLYKFFAVGQRTVRDIGKDNIVDILDWTGADIRSDDVVIEGTSAIVESPAQKRQMAFDLLQAGLFNDPETGRISKEGQAKIFEMLEMGNWDAGDDETQLHLQKAERENRAMAEGGQAMIVPYDDDLLHIARHNKYRLTTDYEELLTANPLLDMLFSQHVQMHMENAQNKAMQQLQEQMAMQALTQPQPQPAETNASPIAYR